MSEFNDRVRDSSAVANLKEANARLGDLLLEEWVLQAQEDRINRLVLVGKNILTRLRADRNLIALQTIGDLDSNSQEFLSAVEQIASSPEEHSYWEHASEVADNLLISASALPLLRIRTSGGVFERVAEQFDSEVKSSTNIFLDKVAAVRSQIEEMRSHVEESSSQLRELVAQLEVTANERVDQAQNETSSMLQQAQSTSESLLSQVRDASTRIERELTNMQKVFRISQEEHREEFNVSQSDREHSFHERIDPIVNDVENYKNQARSMLAEVAGASTAAHYARQRDKQTSAADIWRKIGVAALIVLVVVTAWIFYDTRSTDIDFAVTWLVARSGVAISLSVLATIALRQSSHHRRREEDMSRVSNELQMLWPFMNQLPKEDRETLLKEITPLYFTGGLSAQNSEEKAGRFERIQDILARRGRRESSK